MFETVATNLVTLCVLIIIGFIAEKAGFVSEKASAALSDVLIKIALPSTILMSMQKPFSSELLIDGGIALGLSLVIYFASYPIGLLLCKIMRVKWPDAGVWTCALMFPNVGFMGIPVLNAIYGPDVLFFVSMNNVVFNIMISSFGISVLKRGSRAAKQTGDKNADERARKKSIKRFIPNIVVMSTIIGFILFLLSVKIPGPVAAAFNMAGSMTTPLSMVIIGAMLSRGGVFKALTGAKEYAHILVKLLVMPVIVYFAVSPFVGNKLILDSLVLLTAMPVATMNAIFAVKYGSNGFLASRLVALSTVLSIITLPIVSLLL